MPNHMLSKNISPVRIRTVIQYHDVGNEPSCININSDNTVSSSTTLHGMNVTINVNNELKIMFKRAVEA